MTAQTIAAVDGGEHIRRAFRIPATLGRRVKVHGHPGHVVGFWHDQMVRIQDDASGEMFLVPPTWRGVQWWS